MRGWTLFSVLALAGVLYAGCSRGRKLELSIRDPAQVVVQADWYPQPEYGGFYQAIADGTYHRMGLDVRLRPGSSGTVPQQVVVTGRADFGIGSSTDIILAASRGLPLVIVSAYMEHDPQALMVHRDSAIHTFCDLDNQRVMAVPGSPFIQVIEHLYRIRIGIVPTDFGISRFAANPQAIQQCFVTNEPFYLSQRGIPVRILPLSDTPFRPYRVVYTHRRFLLAHPDIVRAFAEATRIGWLAYVHGDGKAANRLVAQANPQMSGVFMDYAHATLRDQRLVEGDPVKEEAAGKIDLHRLGVLIRQLKEAGLLSRAIAPEAVAPRSFAAGEEAAK